MKCKSAVCGNQWRKHELFRYIGKASKKIRGRGTETPGKASGFEKKSRRESTKENDEEDQKISHL